MAETKAHMEKALGALAHELGKIRTGRASTALVDDIRVDYYGTPTPLNQIGTLGVPEPRLLTISPWEVGLIPVIEKAISTSDLGLTPSNDGKVIRIPIPSLNEERRRELVKMIKKYGEETRVSLRHHRREAMDKLKSLEKSKALTEDEHKHLDKEVQKLIDGYVAKIDEVLAHKEKEIMEV
jgi:ribosome recycling factor